MNNTPKFAGASPTPRRRRLPASPIRIVPSALSIARRRRRIGLAKLLLPTLAACLLAAVALWPELSGDGPLGTASLKGEPITPTGEIIDARYRGVDAAGRRFTITAAIAAQHGPELIDLVDPKGDIGRADGPWMFGEASKGVFDRASRQLDLSGHVMLYRSDGTMLTTHVATIDLAAGVAVGNSRVHVQGPFGTLDAQGFSVSDAGKVVRFAGPGRLVLNAAGQ